MEESDRIEALKYLLELHNIISTKVKDEIKLWILLNAIETLMQELK